MGSRWFNCVVVLFWLASMTWLIVVKVLPPLRRGEPPDYQALYAAMPADDPPVGWKMLWLGDGEKREFGWVVSRTVRNSLGGSAVRSRVHFDNILQLNQMAPPLFRPAIRKAMQPLGQVSMDARTVLDVDPTGQLTGFRSSLQIADSPNVVRVRGDIDGTLLNVEVDSGGLKHEMQRNLPEGTHLGDELSPQARMPPLKVGQTWTAPIYSPLSPSSPVDILEATVEQPELIVWNGQATNALVVAYRSDSGLGFLAAREPRARLWVRADGLVLQQEVSVFGSRLSLVRLADEEAAELATKLDEDPAVRRPEFRPTSGESTAAEAREPVPALEPAGGAT